MSCQPYWSLFRVSNFTNESKKSERLCWPLTESSHPPHTLILGISKIASYEIISYVESMASTSKRDSCWNQIWCFCWHEARSWHWELIFSFLRNQMAGQGCWEYEEREFSLLGWVGGNPKHCQDFGACNPCSNSRVFHWWSIPRFKEESKDCFGRIAIVSVFLNWYEVEQLTEHVM